MTGHELGIKIAQIKGWRVRDLNDNPHGATVKGPNWALINPEGKTVHWGWTPADAWSKGPNYDTDLNMAFKLIDDVPGKFVLQSSAPTFWQAWFGTPSVPQANEDTAALAICRAWYAYTAPLIKGASFERAAATGDGSENGEG